MTDLTRIERPPQQASTDVPPLLILLHGYGSHEHDLMGLADYVDPRYRVISIRAPLTLDMGGYAWFNIEFTPVGMSMDTQEGFRSRDRLLDLISDLQASSGNDGTNTVLLGFSQGGAMAMSLLMEAPQRVAGVAFLSGVWLREFLPEDEEILAALRDKPVLQTHGTDDPLLPIKKAHNTSDILSTLPLDLSYHEYQMGHEISAECLRQMCTWLTDRLPPL
ncbi:MAG: alpha/beta fold hydrolase [Gemmatimonadetes bacterium]|nr:alpha/beta fold hydrolase [Gemmatimonadota bacterium]